MTRAKMSDVALSILRFLRDLERGGRGFERRGVSGWASSPEIQAATGKSYLSEDLVQLHRRGRLQRDDARIAATVSPVWVYRITDTGARQLATADGSEHVSVSAPTADTDERVCVRPGVLAALHALRHAAADGAHLPNPAIPDAPAWRTSLQLTNWLKEEGERTGQEQRFFSDELAWMVRSGIAERRNDPVTLYRITSAGLGVKAMMWREAGTKR